MAKSPTETELEQLRRFRALLLDPERRHGGPGWRTWGRVFAVALIPALLLVLVALASPEPGTMPGGAMDLSGQERMVERAAPMLETSGAGKRLSVETAGGLSDAPETDPAAAEIAAHGLYRAHVLFVSAYVLLMVLGWRVIAAQRTLIRRHAAGFWPRGPRTADQSFAAFHEADFAHPRLWLPETFLLSLSVGIVFALAAPLALPWLALPVTLWGVGVVALASAVVLSAAYLTAYGTYLVSRNYPDAANMRAIARAFRQARDQRAKELRLAAGKAGLPVAERGTMTPDQIAEAARTAWQKACEGPEGCPAGLAPVDRGMGAKDSITVVNAFAFPLVVLFVLTLAVLSLGLDVLEAGLHGPEALVKAADASGGAWLMALGVGFTIVIGIVQMEPVSRLYPFVIEAPSGGKTAWKVEGALFPGKDAGVSVSVRPDSADKPDEFPDEMAHYLGARRAKFRDAMAAAHRGAGFHVLLQETFRDRLKDVAGLLAPAVAGTLLSIFG